MELDHRHYNNTANRAYYAAFQAAVAAMLEAGIAPHRERDGKIVHKHVHSAFAGVLIGGRKLYDATLRTILSESIGIRVRADYEATAVSERQARRVFQDAQKLTEAVEQRLGGQPWP